MEWEKKGEMIKLANAGDNAKFQQFIIENVKNFDYQAWDMFANVTSLAKKEMQEDGGYWKLVYEELKKVDVSSDKLSFRGGMRLSLMQITCRDEIIF